MGGDDWTPLIGLRRSVVSLLWRSLVCLPLWGVLIWLCAPAINLVPMHWAWFGILGLLVATPGVALGHQLSKGLTEDAGFVSPVLTLLAAAFAWAVIIGGVEIVDVWRPLVDWRGPFIEIATGLFATLWVVKATLFDE